MSVRIGTPRSDLIRARIRKPSLRPGPRNAFADERFALSKEALKMQGTPASAAILETHSAIFRLCTSDSITHGPAIRNSGLPPPSRSDLKLISRVVAI